MSFPVKFIKTVRNNWKKSTFAAVAVTYAIAYTKEHYETQELMREYCKKASEYGNANITPGSNPKRITIILNPNANKRKATKQFEKYCAPILHLSGMCVDILQTESEGHAKTLVANLPETDALVVAGGDGTLSEVVTGLLRLNESNSCVVPIGILPLGRSNTIGKRFFPGGDHLEEVHSLADACMAVIEEYTKPVDVMKIEVIDDDKEEEKKPIYALSGLEWGAFRDAHVKRDSYWYFGSLRNYVTYLINGLKNNLCWNCEAIVTYSLPCMGCSNCSETVMSSNKKWYLRFLSNRINNENDRSNVINAQCSLKFEKKIHTADLLLTSENTVISADEKMPKLKLNIGPVEVDYFDFVTKGWQFEKGVERPAGQVIEARQVEIHPVKSAQERWFSIDNENFEVRPIRVTLLPQLISMFVKNEKMAYTS